MAYPATTVSTHGTWRLSSLIRSTTGFTWPGRWQTELLASSLEVAEYEVYIKPAVTLEPGRSPPAMRVGFAAG